MKAALLLAALVSFGAAPAAAWTDDPLIPGVHIIRKIHLDEVRTAINIKLAEYNFSTVSWPTDPTIVTGVTVVKGKQFKDVRDAIETLTNVYRAGGTHPCPYLNVVSSYTWTDSLIPAPNENVVVKALHMTELRRAKDRIGNSRQCCGICHYPQGASGCYTELSGDYYAECGNCAECTVGTCGYLPSGTDYTFCAQCYVCDGTGGCTMASDGYGDSKSCSNCDSSGGCRY